MSAVLAPPPAVAAEAGVGGGAPARRAVIRWAWRLFRREWRQQLMVLVLLTVAVAATILSAAVGVNTPPPQNAGFGTADHLVSLPGNDPSLDADIAAIRRHFGAVDVIEDRPLDTGTVQGAQVRAQDPRGPFGYPMLDVVSGRFPTGPGEVAMTRDLASTYGLVVGGDWSQDGQTRRLVGLVENPQNLLDSFALVAPGQLASPAHVTVLFRATANSLAGFTFPHGVTPQSPPPGGSGLPPAVVVFTFAIFGLIFVGLIAVAGFSVLAQRRMRALGMLTALGGTDQQVRLVMVANGAVVGIVATVTGAVLGLVAWIAYAPHLATSAHHRVVWTSLPWWLVVATMVLAVATSTLAARRPARAASRMPVVAALSGRPASPRPAHRSAVPGLVLLAGGPVMLYFSGGWGGSTAKDQLLQLGGILATAVSVLLVAPLCVALLGRVGRRAPVAVRIALRDLARYRSRSGPALAAITFAVLVAGLTCLLATARYADPVDYFGPNLAVDELVVYPGGSGPGSGPDAGPGVEQAQPDPAQLRAAADSVAATLGNPAVLALESTEAILGQAVPGGVRSYGGSTYVATPEVLRFYGIDPATVDPDALVLTARTGLDRAPDLELVSPTKGPSDCASGCVRNPKIQHLDRLPSGTSEPNILITEHAVDTLKLTPQPAAWLIRSSGPLTAAQINNARQAAVAGGVHIETASQAPSLDALRNYATGAGILLALAVLAMTVGLIRAEAAGDLRTLTATGAAAGTRRTITAATAGSLGLIGAVLGTGVAYLATVALFRSQLSERMTHPPVLDLVLIVVGLPVVATVGGWLLAGRQPPVISRQPIE
jgi:putative ABC transport system permease protein